MLELSKLSKEYVRVPVTATEDGVPVDPTTDVVAFSFPPVYHDPDTWVTGEWEVAGGTTFARILVGPGGDVVLDEGTFHVWLRVTDAPEVPVKRTGQLRIV